VIKPLSLRVRLTAWYFGIVALSFLLISVVALYGMNRSITGAVNNELQDRAKGVRALMERVLGSASGKSLSDELREHSGVSATNDLMQVADAQGHWLYRSRSLIEHAIPLPQHADPVTSTGHFSGLLLRVRSERVSIDGQSFSIQVAVPMHEFREAIEQFQGLLIVAVPFLLLCATAGGYFMSRRALAPVQKVIDAAENIDASSLSSRLAVPATGDELQRLTETLNNMLARIESAFNRVAQFTADASHELRTPLAVLRTRAELALRRPRSESEYREVLERLLHGLERASDLVERLMLLARADSGDQILQSEPLQLDHILKSVCEQGATLAAAKNLHFRTELAPQTAPIEGDPDFLERLFLILVDNAIKYTPAQGEVVVSSELAGNSVLIVVRDNGIGIGDADLPNLFERFYRADKARSRESGGAGLGLAIGRWIVEAHGGQIEVESIQGKGTKVRVRLPAGAAAQPLPQAHPGHEGPHEGS
jgi:heavy metal sensor kinase